MNRRLLHILLALGITLGTLQLLTAAAHPLGSTAFERTWARTDQPVQQSRVNRTWMWGPSGHTEAFMEPYGDAPGGERLVQYLDKSRMEDNSFRAAAPWDVTNGLLATELITGRMQISDTEFETREPARVQVAGDDNPDSPTYETFSYLLDHDPHTINSAILQYIDRDGNVGTDTRFATHGVTAHYHVADTNHTVASVFWTFMNSTGEVYEGGQYGNDRLFENPFFATGFPITEAYWMSVPVAGETRDVLAQCFQRRCLTFTPGNPAGWQVEAGNIGQHYYRWRYELVSQPGTCPAVGPGTYVYVADTMNSRVQKLDSDGNYVCEIGSLGIQPGQFGNAIDVAVDGNGDVYVLSGQVHKFDRNGAFIMRWGDQGDMPSGLPASFTAAHGIAVDSENNVYVAEMGGHQIQKFTSSGTFLTQWGSSGEAAGQFRFPIGIAVGPNDNVYVVDSHNRRVQIFDSSGNYLREIDGSDHFGVNTRHIAVSEQGTVYVADAGGFVHRISSAGVFMDRLDRHRLPGAELGSFGASGITLDSDGTLYTYHNQRTGIHRFTNGSSYAGFWNFEVGTGPGEFRTAGILAGMATWTE